MQYANRSSGKVRSRNQSSNKVTLRKSVLRAAVEVMEPRVLLSSTVVVNSLLDNVNDANISAPTVTLREAVNYENANGGGTIAFSSTLAGQTVSLTTVGDGTFGPSALAISSNITILGPTGASGVTIARGLTGTATADSLRLFYVTSSGDLTLDDLTLSGGLAKGGNGGGTGGGAAGLGGAIVNAGSLNLTNDTLADNSAIGGSGTNSLDGGAGGGLGGDGVGAANVPGGPNAAGQNPAGFGGGGSPVGLSGFGGGGALGRGGFGGGGGGQTSGNFLIFPGGFGAGTGAGQTAGAGGGGGAGLGGAVFNYGGSVAITNSTLADNSAQGGIGGTGAQNGQGLGGAIFNLNGTINATFATLADNTAAQGGGAIYSLGDNGVATQAGPVLPSNTATVNLTDSILADSNDGSATPVSDYVQNTNNSGGVNGAIGSVASSGTHNIIQTTATTGSFAGTASYADPLLGTLGNYGGPTETLPLLPGSPAIGAGIAESGIATDQRGVPRPLIGTDIGAFQTPLTYVADLAPSSGPIAGGSLETLSTGTASNFNLSGDWSVTMGGVQVPAIPATSEAIVFTLPSETALIADGVTTLPGIPVVFHAADGTSSNTVFFYYNAPLLLSASPSTPIPMEGGTVTLTGADLLPGDGGSLVVGGETIDPSQIQSSSFTQIVFTAPPLASLDVTQVANGVASVSAMVINPGGLVSNVKSLSYSALAPTITTISGGQSQIGNTTEVLAVGGNTITISGSSLYDPTSNSLSLTVNGVAVQATNIIPNPTNPNSQLTFIMPSTVAEVGAGTGIAWLTFQDGIGTSDALPIYIGGLPSGNTPAIEITGNSAPYAGASSSDLGYAVTLAATLAASSTPTGTIQFLDNGVDIGSLMALSNGSASLTTTTLPAGSNTITANYIGGNFSTTTSPDFTWTVNYNAALQTPPGTYSATGKDDSTAMLATPGYFVPLAGSTFQTEATPGFYDPGYGNTTAIGANPGYYQPNAGQTQELPATLGFYAPGYGSITTIQASPGYYVPNPASATQTPADPGYYVATPGQSAETPAPLGYYVPTAAATSATEAQLGYSVSTIAATAATAAQPGYYVPTLGATAATEATPGYFVATAGASSETPAGQGFYVSTYGATAATGTPSGYYNNVTGATAPIIDPAGTYSVKNPPSAQGQTEPTLAPLGTYVPNEGATAATQAPAGYYVDTLGATAATAAQPGYYVPLAGASAATEAGAGYYVPTVAAVAEIPDPTGTTSGPGATKAIPTVTVQPINIVYGTPLANSQLTNTTATVPGTLTFNSAAGMTLSAYYNQTESITFTPDDTADFATVVTTVTVNVSPFVPTLTVTDAGGVYNGSPFPATALVIGISGVPTTSLEGESPQVRYYAGTYTNSAQLTAANATALASAPADAGDYTAVGGFSGGDTNDYGGTPIIFTNFSITPAAPTVTVSDAGGPATGSPFAATATVTGVSGATLSASTVTFTYYNATGTTLGSTLSTAPSAVGNYAVIASYPGDGLDYGSASSQPAFFSITAPQSISGTVYNDLNGNGHMDGGDPGLAGDSVQLSFMGVSIESTATDANGNFSFTLPNFPQGNYTLQVQTPAGYVATSPSQQNFTISNSANLVLPSVGFFKPVSVSGNVFLDANDDGVQDNGEAGMSGTTVDLLNASGTIVATTTSNASGAYSFTNVGPGTFTVAEIAPAGYVQTGPAPVPPGSYSFTASSGTNLTGDSFGNVPAAPAVPAFGLLLLDATGSGSLTVSGAAKVIATGNTVVVNSNSATAVKVSGSASVSDSLTEVVGKASITGAGKVSGLQTGQAKAVDPFASLATPTTAGLVTRSTSTDSIAGSSTVTLQPGVYIGGITIGGAAKVTLAPGEYYLEGGGFNVAGSAVVTGAGVFIYNAPTKSSDQFTVSGAAKLTLSPQTTGAWAGITIFQARTVTNAIDISGSGAVDVTGEIYAADATVNISGAASVDTFGDSLIAYDLIDSGSGELVV